MYRAAFCAFMLGSPVVAQDISAVHFMEPTGRYGHYPMGPGVDDHGALVLTLTDGSQRVIRLPESRVFEDNLARLVDVTGDSAPEVVVVESDQTLGARLSVYGPDGLIAASPFIGQRHRWYALAGIADLDGDGIVEIVAVDRPHLRRMLVVWHVVGEQLVPRATFSGVTNHRFGEPDIDGGLRSCGDGPEIIVARADWSGLVSVRFDGTNLSGRDLGAGASAARFAQIMTCAD